MKEKLKKAVNYFVNGPEDYQPTVSSATIKILAGGYLIYLVYKMYQNVEGKYTFFFILASVLFVLIGILFILWGFFMYKKAMNPPKDEAVIASDDDTAGEDQEDGEEDEDTDGDENTEAPETEEKEE